MDPAALAAIIMVWKLKFHKQKLLRQVAFLDGEISNHNLHKLRVLRCYLLQWQEDYMCCHQLSHSVRELAWCLCDLPQGDPFLMCALAALGDKIYALGLVPMRGSLELCDSVMASSSCRCLPTMLFKLHTAQHLQATMAFVEQGHMRVVPGVVT